MKNELNISIQPMIFPDDKNEIASWEEKYKNDKDFESIAHYILEDQTYMGLGEVIETNHEIFAIGDDERKYAFVAKNTNGEIVAWALIDFFDITTQKPEMFIQYIVVHPKMQHKGYGEAVAKELIFNAKKYIGGQPKNFFAYIDKTNLSSRKLFEKFGFGFKSMTAQFLKAETNEPRLENNNSPSEFGE